MGRFEKSVFINGGVDRRELGYYSTPDFIAKFMTNVMIKIKPNGKTALDPCVGKEELIKHLYDKGINIDGIDIEDHGDSYYCNFKKIDFIEYYKRLKLNTFFSQDINLHYDYYIANPPYNCHEVDYIKNNKKVLNELFDGIGVHNMYSMFISSVIDCAKEGALMSLIVSDSFLTAKMHKSLRAKILNTCSIHYVALCPSDLFRDQKADVRTCIIILQKGRKHQGIIKVLDRPENKDELKDKLENDIFLEVNLPDLVNMSGKGEFEFVIGLPIEIQSLFAYPKLGDVFRCVTGISTGQDSLYISKESKEGFKTPFFKNPGLRKFYCEPDGFLTDEYLKLDKSIKNFMVRNKSLMLQEGITCSSMGLPFSACYLPSGSTFGVNANIFCEHENLWWLLSYLNSSLVTYIVRGVLIRSNMITSGYVSKIPLLQVSNSAKARLEKLSLQAFNNKVKPKENRQIISEIDDIIFGEMQLSQETKDMIVSFASNLQSRV